ncbi:MAG: MFS transporter [Chloroflexota bacterium]|nr:MAG: MFS transporter [Chloroflexota bacterium]
MTRRLPFHYAYVIAAVTFLALLASAGVRNAPAVIIRPLEAEFGWSRSAISLAIAVSLLWFGLGAPLGGTLVEKFGPRRVFLAALIVIEVGLWGMLAFTTMLGLHFFWGVVVGIGTGMATNVLGATIAIRWFEKKRSLFVGIFSAASAAGQLIFLPALISINANDGWRMVIETLALAILATMPLVFFLLRDTPQEMGLRAVGSTAVPRETSSAALGKSVPMQTAMRSRDFWLLAASFFICGYTTNGLIGTHLLPHAVEHGFADVVAASALSLMGAMNIAGTLASGWLSDRYDNRVLLAIYYSGRASTLLLLPFIGDSIGLFGFAFLYGLDWVATVPPTVNLTSQMFGKASVGKVYGWIFFTHMVGAATAAYLGGVVRDTFGDYTFAFFSAAALGFIAAAFSMGVRRAPVKSLVGVAGE